MADIYLDDLRFRDWWALYRIAKNPQFFYRAFNEDNSFIPWRVLRYIIRAKKGLRSSFYWRVVKAIRLTNTKKLVGCVLLVDLHKAKYGQAETGTIIAVPYQGKHIGTKARLRFMDWCLNHYDIQVIESYAHPDNIASIKMQKIGGLKETGYIAANNEIYRGRNGQSEPRVVMSATRAEIEQALQSAREQGLYTRDITVL